METHAEVQGSEQEVCGAKSNPSRLELVRAASLRLEVAAEDANLGKSEERSSQAVRTACVKALR